MIRISDHALVRFLERSGALDIEQLRTVLAAALDRGRRSAERIGIGDYVIVADGMKFVIQGDVVVTVLDEHMPMRHRRPGGRR
ncbi:hypothetical protein AB4099_05405 [Bosea sp. 2KB_26]|uniref:hypothetical protein n=1 Tax=Bosea sp. 2KB_26 TaxID=3237475 RepID=UPI003F8EAE55